MGVTDLWTVLEPVKTRLNVASLRGQFVAVDLSIWIVSCQSVKKMQGVVAKPHLRNLFFRAAYLLRAGVMPVFVIEGNAPEVKWDTIAERSRSKRAVGRCARSLKQAACLGAPRLKPRRPQLSTAIKECCQLLDCLGVSYVRASGEAEALCAALSRDGIVDAVITEDGDAFLYGAKKIYRNFAMKDACVDSYDMADVERRLQLSQEKLVAWALLVGCDYAPGGVRGVGKGQAACLLQAMPGTLVIGRLRAWKTEPLKDLPQHEKQVAEKAVLPPDFPNEKIISEFLGSHQDAAHTKYSRSPWRVPRIAELQVFLSEKLEWPLSYAADKCIPLMTLWQMTAAADELDSTTGCIKPLRIVKRRTRDGVACVEVEWENPGCLWHDADEPERSVFTTLEDLQLFEKCYFQLMHAYECSRKREGTAKVLDAVTKVKDKEQQSLPAPRQTGAGKKSNFLQDVMSSMSNLTLSIGKTAEPVSNVLVGSRRQKAAEFSTSASADSRRQEAAESVRAALADSRRQKAAETACALLAESKRQKAAQPVSAVLADSRRLNLAHSKVHVSLAASKAIAEGMLHRQLHAVNPLLPELEDCSQENDKLLNNPLALTALASQSVVVLSSDSEDDSKSNALRYGIVAPHAATLQSHKQPLSFRPRDSSQGSGDASSISSVRHHGVPSDDNSDSSFKWSAHSSSSVSASPGMSAADTADICLPEVADCLNNTIFLFDLSEHGTDLSEMSNCSPKFMPEASLMKKKDTLVSNTVCCKGICDSSPNPCFELKLCMEVTSPEKNLARLAQGGTADAIEFCSHARTVPANSALQLPATTCCSPLPLSERLKSRLGF